MSLDLILSIFSQTPFYDPCYWLTRLCGARTSAANLQPVQARACGVMLLCSLMALNLLEAADKINGRVSDQILSVCNDRPFFALKY